jgi:4-hydroxybutyrate dehydrogenase
MKIFSLNSKICECDTFAEFAKEFEIAQGDLVFTHRFLYNDYMKGLNLGCTYLFQEDYGLGEPNDAMVNAIIKDISDKRIKRVIGIGGGTVMDISKLLCIEDAKSIEDIFEDKIPLVREKGLVLVPTTCGTGSELTCVSVVDIPKRKSKIGKRIEANFADEAVLIPELVEKLPYSIFLYSSVDALIHAMEIFLAPTGNAFNNVFCAEAIRIIVDRYKRIAKNGPEERYKYMRDFLRASTYAGIALSNTVCGAVHACAMHFGGKHHIPHGESNYRFLMGVFNKYAQKDPNGCIKDLAAIINDVLGIQTDIVGSFLALEELLCKLIPKKPLREYGMAREELGEYVDQVIETQQRLLVNSYVPLSREDFLEIYNSLY